ncbi:uncharacterized protein LOC141854270 isoform X2 [Brevipalpus obovatus]|uniref:uncharacterized protein LOC141854270 isoform X2 n=1 Tax=Brevipalpus obovatus TaxID=246614 RepID=UPI003D9EFC63
MDSDFIEESRFASHNSESRTLHVLSDLVKGTVDITTDIQRSLDRLGFNTTVDESSVNKDELLPSLEDALERISQNELTLDFGEDGHDLGLSLELSANLLANSRNQYSLSYSSKEPSPGFGSGAKDDLVLVTQKRLRAYVERLLHLLRQHVDLNRNNDAQNLIKKNDELVNNLNSGLTRQEKLTNQLIQVEEKAKDLEQRNLILEQKLENYDELKNELDFYKQKAGFYELERSQVLVDQERLRSEKHAFSKGLPALQKNLLMDTEKLDASIKSLRQENKDLQRKIQVLENDKQQTGKELESVSESHQQQLEDLGEQLDAANRQLASQKKFIQEQVRERETERDDFVKTVAKTKEEMKDKEKTIQKLKDEIESLEIQISALHDDKKRLEERISSLNRDLARVTKENDELRQIWTQARRENENWNDIEKELIARCSDLEEKLNIQLNINQQLQSEQSNNTTVLRDSLFDHISAGTDKIKATLSLIQDEEIEGENLHQSMESEENIPASCEDKAPISPWESIDRSSAECSFVDAQLLGDRLRQLNQYIDKLITKNSEQAREISDLNDEKMLNKEKMDELRRKLVKLEEEVRGKTRATDLLQEELTDKNLKLSALKTRIDGTSCLDVNQLRTSINELKKKLSFEITKNEHLSQQIDHLRAHLDDKSAKISQLTEEINALENDKLTLESEMNEHVEDNQLLVEKQHKLQEMLHQLSPVKLSNGQHQSSINNVINRSLRENGLEKDSQRSDTMDQVPLSPLVNGFCDEINELIPQLMQRVIKDKNEEIRILTDQIVEIEQKLRTVVSSDSNDINLLLEEIITSYKLMREELTRKNSQNLDNTKSPPPSPKCSVFKEKCVNTDPTPEFLVSDHINRVAQDSPEKAQDSVLVDFELKCNRMYSRLNNLKEENNVLRYELDNLKDTKALETSNHENVDKDGIFVEIALNKIHQQSVELLRLTESRRNSSGDSVIKQLLQTLPLVPISNSQDMSSIDSLITNEAMRRTFLQNFPSKEIGTMFLDKLTQLYAILNEARGQIFSHSEQNELISQKLAEVEDALIEKQAKLELYKAKYNEAKKILKYHNFFKSTKNQASQPNLC